MKDANRKEKTMETAKEHREEAVSDVLLILRRAAGGEFAGSTGDVVDNLRVLMGRGKGDSLAGIFDEICDRIEQAQARERLSLFIDGEEVIDRLRAVGLEKGTLGNLSAIATAILGVKPFFGWTRDACERLRHELIMLLGGAS